MAQGVRRGGWPTAATLCNHLTISDYLCAPWPRPSPLPRKNALDSAGHRTGKARQGFSCPSMEGGQWPTESGSELPWSGFSATLSTHTGSRSSSHAGRRYSRHRMKGGAGRVNWVRKERVADLVAAQLGWQPSLSS